ncbi:MAG: YdeI/OmpD-associated family protein [Candidatus Taylorbacteria bacterium]|nr:YdeI/OmpD-associated family protein [Candidatus Taylorbacteria bacterium]
MHKVPADLRKVLASSKAARAAWEDSTPLARNEWLCWILSAKYAKTRSRRTERTQKELIDGKRRPCCFAGCIHRSKYVENSK